MLLANTRAGTAEPVGRHKEEGKTDLGVVLLITLPVFVFITVRLAMKRRS